MVDRSDTVEDYIASFPPEVREVLDRITAAVHEAVPGLEVGISYQMLGFRRDGRYLFYVGGWKQHVGLYPVPRLGGELEEEVAPYRAAQDSLRFPYRKEIPYDLIARVVDVIAARRKSA